MIKVVCRDRQNNVVAVFRGTPFIAMTSLYMNGDLNPVARYDPESNRWRLTLIHEQTSFASLSFTCEG